jgi:hypothetical protein
LLAILGEHHKYNRYSGVFNRGQRENAVRLFALFGKNRGKAATSRRTSMALRNAGAKI